MQFAGSMKLPFRDHRIAWSFHDYLRIGGMDVVGPRAMACSGAFGSYPKLDERRTADMECRVRCLRENLGRLETMLQSTGKLQATRPWRNGSLTSLVPRDITVSGVAARSVKSNIWYSGQTRCVFREIGNRFYLYYAVYLVCHWSNANLTFRWWVMMINDDDYHIWWVMTKDNEWWWLTMTIMMECDEWRLCRCMMNDNKWRETTSSDNWRRWWKITNDDAIMIMAIDEMTKDDEWW